MKYKNVWLNIQFLLITYVFVVWFLTMCMCVLRKHSCLGARSQQPAL